LKKEQSNIDKPVQSASKPSHIKIGESKQRKEEDKDSRRKKQLIERCESVIEDTEKEIKLVEIELAELPDKNKLAELINKSDVLKEKLSKLMEDWEKLHN
jgi:hypothetical protein